MSEAATAEWIKCGRCGAPIVGETVAEWEAAKRMGLVISPCCQACCDAFDRARTPVRPRVAFPDDWPRRAIDALPGFVGEPRARGMKMLPFLSGKGNGTVAVLGDRGRGKTVLACWVALQRMERGQSAGIYVRAHDLFATIRRAWHASSKEDEWTALERFRNAPFLVIDEFQERSASDWENRVLVNILDHRHADKRPSLLVGNQTADDFAAHVGPSILDRIKETGALLLCDWGNLRFKIKPA